MGGMDGSPHPREVTLWRKPPGVMQVRRYLGPGERLGTPSCGDDIVSVRLPPLHIAILAQGLRPPFYIILLGRDLGQ